MRTIYGGSFSKVLFPALRLGYLVVPADVVDAFVAAVSFGICALLALEQVVLAEFMAAGHFTRHLREMRLLYAERQQALAERVRQEVGGLVELAPSQAGMHLVAWLPDSADDQTVADRADAQRVTVMPLSRTAIDRPERRALLLGYAAANESEMRRGVQQLAAVLAMQQRQTHDTTGD
jgi:GntR family transcriptional regulator/MocR family aminotransferase